MKNTLSTHFSRAQFIALLFPFFLATAAFYWTSLGGSYNEMGRGICFSLAPTIAFFVGALATKRQGLHTPRGRTMLFLSLGILGFALGEILWTYYDLVLQTDPFPSIADVFYSLAYPFLFLGLVNELRTQKLNFRSTHKLLLISLFVNAVVFSVIIGYMAVYKTFDPALSFWENFFAIAYQLGDLALIIMNFFAFFLAWEERKEGLTCAWFYFFCAATTMLFADILFGIFEVEHADKVWPYFQAIDFIWVLSYMYFAVSFFEFRLNTKEPLLKRSRLLA